MMALEEGDTEPVTVEGAQAVVVRTVADMVMAPGMGTTTIRRSTMAHTSTVLGSTLTSRLIY